MSENVRKCPEMSGFFEMVLDFPSMIYCFWAMYRAFVVMEAFPVDVALGCHLEKKRCPLYLVSNGRKFWSCFLEIGRFFKN
jgi:hypothetical protein